MWMLTVVFAFVASIAACAGPFEWFNNTIPHKVSESFNNTECLDRAIGVIGDLSRCECHSWSRNDINTILEVKCLEGIPVIDTLPDNVESLIIQKADGEQVIRLFKELENPSLVNLRQLTIVNVSLPESNITLPLLRGLVMLNISGNDLVDFSDMQIADDNALKKLDLSCNRLNGLASHAFRTLTRLADLSLRGNMIDTVDENAFAGLQALQNLDVSDNRLTQLPDTTLRYLSSLQTLNLSGNQLKILGARWFEALGHLRELDVSRNGLTKAASAALQPLPGLSVLRLAENPLMEHDVSLLLGTVKRLETVDASRTGLLRVPAALTRSVRALRLAGNKLTCIRDGDFDGYPLLKTLELSDNLLTVVEEDALGRLETLEELDLSENRLQFIPKRLPGSLIHLNLRGNLIEDVSSNDLDGMNNIRSLALDDNMLVVIEQGAFSQLPLLTDLDISNNPIKQLPANTLAGPISLTKLKMSGLTQLEWKHERRGDMTFPVPTPEGLIYLDISNSPVLAAQLLADNATLSACKSLRILNLAKNNITTISIDIIYLLPELHTLGLFDNQWNCTDNIFWLGEWIRQHEEIPPPAKCNSTNEFPNTQLGTLPLALMRPITKTMEEITKTSTLRNVPLDSVHSLKSENFRKFSIAHILPYNASVDGYLHKDMHSAKLLNDKDHLNKVSTASSEGLSYMGDHYQPKWTETQYNRDRGMREFDKFVRRKTLESKQFFSSPSRNRPKVSAIIDNREEPVMKPAMNMPSKIGIYGTIASSSLNNVLKSVSFANINAVPRTHDNVPSRDTIVQLVEDRTKNAPQNYILANAIANTIAQELNGHATEIDARISEPIGAHPGILVLACTIFAAAAALTIILARRATIRCAVRYERHENIEVHTLTPATDLW